MTDPNLWNQLLIWPIVNLLAGFYRLFEWLHVPGPLGFAVIALTILLRFLLYPLMATQMKSARKMAKLKPHLDTLSHKHKDDKPALQQAQMALYKEHGINPAAGCLPLLLQMPVLIALYNVFYQVLGNGNIAKIIEEINAVVYSPILRLTNLDFNFFGINLAIKPSEWQQQGWWLLSIPVITAGLQWYQSKIMLPATTAVVDKSLAINKKKTKLDKEVPEKKEDTAAEMQKQMAIISPLMFGYFAFQFPLGLALYWNIFGILGIIQQLQINKADK